jgi:nitroreductase
MDKTATTRVPVHPLIAGRWSTRAFDAAHTLEPTEIAAMLEAARWAPSANNTQPWRFLVARRGDAAFAALFDLLAPGNRQWAGAASALILVAAQTENEDGTPQPYAQYDTGQAVAHLVAQAEHDGLAAHQMGGFDRAAAAERFDLAAGLQPVVVVAVGRRDETVELPEPFASREGAPRVRREIGELMLDASCERALQAA